jgi:hypothetical protein
MCTFSAINGLSQALEMPPAPTTMALGMADSFHGAGRKA